VGRSHASDVYDVVEQPAVRADDPGETRSGQVPSSSSFLGRFPPNARLIALAVVLSGGTGAGTSLLGGLFDRQDPELRRDVDAHALAIAGLATRLDKCDAEVDAVAEDGREMQLWIASSMPMIANGLEIVGKAVGAEVKIALPQLPGRGRR